MESKAHSQDSWQTETKLISQATSGHGDYADDFEQELHTESNLLLETGEEVAEVSGQAIQMCSGFSPLSW